MVVIAVTRVHRNVKNNKNIFPNKQSFYHISLFVTKPSLSCLLIYKSYINIVQN